MGLPSGAYDLPRTLTVIKVPGPPDKLHNGDSDVRDV